MKNKTFFEKWLALIMSITVAIMVMNIVLTIILSLVIIVLRLPDTIVLFLMLLGISIALLSGILAFKKLFRHFKDEFQDINNVGK